jgi:trehalose 6-phosphate synthase/phosphatase
MSNRLVVVSNRLPLTLRKTNGRWNSEKSSGGLVSAMTPLLQKTTGIWIGWSGESEGADGEQRRAVFKEWERSEHCFAIELSAGVAKGFYEGYANQTLWPVFHCFPSRLRFDAKGWDSYVEANRTFCRAVVDRYQPGDLVWVHDYHLMLLPQMLRTALPDAAVGFFLHIPFPPAEIFPILPRREELLQGLLGADLLAFQTHSHVQQFRSSVLRVLGIESRITEIGIGNRAVRLEALPIGIAPEEYTNLLANDKTTARYYDESISRYKGQRVILAVDRLDYTKGIPERLRSFRRLLESSPELREKVILIQVAVPTREAIDMYQELRTEVNQLIGEINGKVGTSGWTPVVYVNRSIERQELVALYRLADVCWVGCLRDGMNLIAKEYVACNGEGDGVLLLSEFAGAAAEMGEALLINPFDEERTAQVVARALNLEEEERCSRMQALHRRVIRNDVFHWGKRFMQILEETVSARSGVGDAQPKRLPNAEIHQAYLRANRRLLILDYDGTLVPFADTPQRAVPSPNVVRLLSTLAAEPRNVVALISGRRAQDLDRWFGAVEDLWLIAEHGAELKPPHSGAWEPLRPKFSTDWKSTVMPILEHFVDRIPGSFLEEKKFALVWHYRMTEPEFGEWLANELVSTLEGMLAETELRALRGNKIVEVRPVWANKGEAFEHLRPTQPDPDFLLALGDDRTDEDLFERVPSGNWTIHVGAGPTRASFVLPDSQSVGALLEMFCKRPEAMDAASGA